MLDEFSQAVKEYQTKWDTLVQTRKDKAFFESLKPTAVGWKVADRSEYDRIYAELHDQCDRIIETWMNGRWIAKMHFRETTLPGGIEIVKVMLRRPGSDDALGLDHMDFHTPDTGQVEQILKAEPNLKWTHEDNDAIKGYGWISIWFEETEAKVKQGSVLDIIAGELQEISQAITGK